MNAFRLIADSAHVLAIWILFLKFFSKWSAKGISGRTQILFALLFCMRYLDLATNFVSLYNTSLKVFFIFGSISAVLAVFCILRESYEAKFDTFRIELLVLPATLLALYINHEYSVMEVCWTWSIYMEAVALLPQFYMTLRGGHVDSYLISYLTSLGVYRGFYIGNWVYRYQYESYLDPIASISGIVETSITLIGLVLVLMKYWKVCCFSESSDRIPSIYTLPFVTQGFARDYHLVQSEKGIGKQIGGPYNPDLSVPILQAEEENA